MRDDSNDPVTVHTLRETVEGFAAVSSSIMLALEKGGIIPDGYFANVLRTFAEASAKLSEQGEKRVAVQIMNGVCNLVEKPDMKQPFKLQVIEGGKRDDT